MKNLILSIRWQVEQFPNHDGKYKQKEIEYN